MNQARRRARRRGGQPSRKGHGTRTWLLGAGGLVVAFVLGWALVAAGRGSSSSSDVGCSAMEQLSYHVHAHLSIYVDGQEVPVAPNLGIHATCISWLHTHSADGVIHVEAPSAHTYRLGEFFQVWGQPLDATHLLDHASDGTHQIVAYVNGQRYQGSPDGIPLDPHAVIVLEYGLPLVPPPPYTFPQGV